MSSLIGPRGASVRLLAEEVISRGTRSGLLKNTIRRVLDQVGHFLLLVVVVSVTVVVYNTDSILYLKISV